MAVAFDARSRSHPTDRDNSVSEDSFTWNHAGAASNVKGVAVAIFSTVVGSYVTSVTYGGVEMAALDGGVATDTLTEPGQCEIWTLHSGIPQGTQAIVVNRVNNGVVLSAMAVSVTAAADTEVYTSGIVLLQENGTLAEQNVDDGSPGTNSLRLAAGYSGLALTIPVGANSTLVYNHEIFSAQTCAMVRETTAGQGSRPVGFSSGTSDDRAYVHFAIRETAAASALPKRMTLLGTG